MNKDEAIKKISNSDFSDELENILFALDSIEVMKAAVDNAECPASFLCHMAFTSDVSIRGKVAEHPNALKRMLEAMLRVENSPDIINVIEGRLKGE
jgi:hypothetical protein